MMVISTAVDSRLQKRFEDWNVMCVNILSKQDDIFHQ